MSFWYRGLGLVFVCWALVAEAAQLRVATYNVRNYLVQERRLENGRWQEAPKLWREKEALHAVIVEAQADVLALQEMGGDVFVQELQAELRARGLDYPYWACHGAFDTVRHTAVLSRVPIVSSRNISDLTYAYEGERRSVKRGLLEVCFEQPQPWALYVVHLKSKYTSDKRDPLSANQRRGEARVVRDWLLREAVREDYLLVGDVNDTPNQSPVRHLLQKNGEEIHYLIPASDGHGLTWTHYYKKGETYSLIDYIFTSPAMKKRWRVGSASIVDIPASWVASDHRLVYADFVWQAAQ